MYSDYIHRFTGTETRCINLGSYNYLGFAESTGSCAEESIETLKNLGCASCSTRLELGTNLQFIKTKIVFGII